MNNNLENWCSLLRDGEGEDIRKEYIEYARKHNSIEANLEVLHTIEILVPSGSLHELNRLFENLLCSDVVESYNGLDCVTIILLDYICDLDDKTEVHYRVVENLIKFMELQLNSAVKNFHSSYDDVIASSKLSALKYMLTHILTEPVVSGMPAPIPEKYAVLKDSVQQFNRHLSYYKKYSQRWKQFWQ